MSKATGKQDTYQVPLEGDYKHIFMHNPTPMYIFDVETLDFLEVNNAALRQYGYTREEFLTLNARDIRPPSELGQFINDIHSMRGKVNYAGDWTHKRKNGELITVNVISHPFEFNGREARHIMATDVTEQRAMEKKLQNSESRFRMMVEAAPDPIFIQIDGKFAYVNKSLLNAFGINSEEEIIGRNVLDFVHPAYREIVKKRVARLNIDRLPVNDLLELRFITGHDKEIWVETAGQPVEYEGREGALVFMRDITQRRKTDEALKYQQFLLREMGKIAKIGGWEFDPVTGEGSWTEEVAKIHYLDPLDEINVEKAIGFYTEDSKRIITAAIENTIKNKVPYDLELELVAADGTVKWVHTHGQPVIENGVVKKVRGSFQDITQRKTDEQRILQLNADLEHKIEERTRQLTMVNKDLEAFAYSVSHDLRAPLRSINGLTQILQESYDGALDNEGKRLTERIKANSMKMSKLIEDLLSFSKASTSEIKKSKVNMNQLIRSALADYNDKELLKSIELKVADLPETHGDPALLKQVWVNLLSNAIKFSARKEHPVVEVSGQRRGDKTFYKIKDNGAGFNMKYSDKLFAAFQRLHSEQEFQGTGAGLAIVSRILLKHGGSIWAEGEEGKGATFTFCLPG